MGNQGREEQIRQDIKAALERLRNGIRTRVHPRDQWKFLDVVDRIQDFVMTPTGDLTQVQSSIQRTKESARVTLRAKPVDMVQLLTELDGVEQEVVSFFSKLLQRG
jgi:hypothetical protein